jgi:hypothetical protein
MNLKSLNFLRDASTYEGQIGFCEEKNILGKKIY